MHAFCTHPAHKSLESLHSYHLDKQRLNTMSDIKNELLTLTSIIYIYKKNLSSNLFHLPNAEPQNLQVRLHISFLFGESICNPPQSRQASVLLDKINRENVRHDHSKCRWNLEALSSKGVFRFVLAVSKDLFRVIEVPQTEQYQNLNELL